MAPNAGYSGLALRIDHRGALAIGAESARPRGDRRLHPPHGGLRPPAGPPHLQPSDDCCFPAARAKASVHDPVAALYGRLYPCSEISYHENFDPGTHNYDRDNREALYRFLGRLGYPKGPPVEGEIPAEGQILSPEALNVGLPPDPLSSRSMSFSVMGFR